MTLGWRNQDNIRKWFFNSNIITPVQHKRWFAQYLDRDDDFVFIIEEKESGFRPVGQVAIYNVDWDALQAEFGRLMIGEPDALGKGLAHAASQAVLQIAFKDFGLHQVYLEVFAENHRAISIYEFLGFTVTEKSNDIIKMTIYKENARM